MNRPLASRQRHPSAILVAGSVAVLALPFLLGVVSAQGARTLAIDPAGSHVTIAVGRSGVLGGLAGHDHEVLASAVSGKVVVDATDWARSSVTLAFDASKLTVTGKGEPAADVPAVQSAMLSEHVLDVTRFSTIAFRSSRVSAKPGPTGIDMVIDGDFTLHGVTHPLTVRGMVTMESSGLTVRGTCTIKQTEFGMVPPSAAGGTVKAKDDVRVDFVLKAR
jgi:polyisoprenoid-binding protein YceI